MSSTAKLMLRGASLRVIKTIVSIVIGFMMMPFLINQLGDHLYGLWITIGSVVAAYYLLDLGFSQAVTRYVAKCIHQQDYPGANRIINTALAIYSALAVLIILLTLLLSSTAVQSLVENPDDLKLVQILVLITGIALAFEFPAKAFPGIINAYMRYDTTAIVALLKTVIDAVFIYLFIENGYGLVAMAMVGFVTSILSTAFYMYYCHQLFRQLEYRKENIDLETTKEIFNFSKWVFVIDANRLLKEKMDVWLIAFYGSAALVTVYYVAVRLVEYAIQFLVQATGISNTLFTKYYALGDEKKLVWSVNFFVKINCLFTLLFINGFYLVGFEFITIWMGKDFEVALAYQCLLILAVGKMATYATAPLGGLLLTIKKHSFSAKLSIVETVISGALCIWLIPAKGLVGAAISIALPLLVTRLIILPVYTQKHLRFMSLGLLMRLLVTTTLSIFTAYFLKLFFSPREAYALKDLLILSIGYLCLLPILLLVLLDKDELLQIKGMIMKKLKKSPSK
ncbi:MAG TPA: oligosaccharide flippase family protein [Cellvibrio sp.]